MSPAEEYVALEQRYQKVLEALFFWLPSVPRDGSKEIIERIANDSFLLVDLDGQGYQLPDAESLGWIELMPQIEQVEEKMCACPGGEAEHLKSCVYVR